MKRLAILRHAKSSWDDPGLDDFNRPLNERGWKAARRLGRELKQRGIRFDLVLSSTSARTRQTIDGVEETFDFGAPIEFDPQLYLASEQLLLERVRALDEETDAPLIVGHNPGVEQLITGLTLGDRNGLREPVAGKFPTGALAVIELPAKRWADVEPGRGEIVELILPKELD
ncbi:MAG: histidine phosphatase family protein [Pseudomonadota bacterium]